MTILSILSNICFLEVRVIFNQSFSLGLVRTEQLQRCICNLFSFLFNIISFRFKGFKFRAEGAKWHRVKFFTYNQGQELHLLSQSGLQQEAESLRDLLIFFAGLSQKNQTQQEALWRGNLLTFWICCFLYVRTYLCSRGPACHKGSWRSYLS